MKILDNALLLSLLLPLASGLPIGSLFKRSDGQVSACDNPEGYLDFSTWFGSYSGYAKKECAQSPGSLPEAPPQGPVPCDNPEGYLDFSTWFGSYAGYAKGTKECALNPDAPSEIPPLNPATGVDPTTSTPVQDGVVAPDSGFISTPGNGSPVVDPVDD